MLADSHTAQVFSVLRIVKELIARKCFPLHSLVLGDRKSLTTVQQCVVEGNGWRSPEPLSPGAPEFALSRTYRRSRNKSLQSEGVQTRKEIESFSREQAIWRGYVVNY